MSNSAPELLEDDTKQTLAQSIDERRSQEIVIALVGPVGSGVTTTGKFIADILSQEYNYAVCPPIKLSEIIKAESHRVDITAPPTDPRDAYITTMQDAGNRLREKFGGEYLSEKAVERIVKYRKAQGGYPTAGMVPAPGRRAYIIDSIKNIEELSLLRKIYGETLCVFGVFAPDQKRIDRLLNNGIPKGQVSKIIDRDQGEVATFGQKTRKLFVESDFFLCNDRKLEELQGSIRRLLEIIFKVGVHTPRRAESAMYEAASAAGRSGCMSRQVGASIISSSGELIAVGWNDVPRFGGGLYHEDNQFEIDPSKGIVDNDNRCFKWNQRICHNEQRRKKIVDGVANRVCNSGHLKRGTSIMDIRTLLNGTEVDDLIEFSRSIHAEMEAILSVAREGKRSLVGATLFTSTYPCHNCARHIVAAGIRQVVYIEPYKKA